MYFYYSLITEVANTRYTKNKVGCLSEQAKGSSSLPERADTKYPW